MIDTNKEQMLHFSASHCIQSIKVQIAESRVKLVLIHSSSVQFSRHCVVRVEFNTALCLLQKVKIEPLESKIETTVVSSVVSSIYTDFFP